MLCKRIYFWFQPSSYLFLILLRLTPRGGGGVDIVKYFDLSNLKIYPI